MTASGHLWAVGYDDMRRADHLRDEIIRLGWVTHSLLLDDVAVVVQHPDGSFTFNRKPYHVPTHILGCSAVGFLVGLILAAPVTGASIGAALGAAGAAAVRSVGIGEGFVREVEGLMKPGTSALFVLDNEGDMDLILHGLRGLGGTVLKSNVDVERARLIQSTLAASSRDPSPSPKSG